MTATTTSGGGREAYAHGHHESVLRSHGWRTAENSAGYLLPHLHRGADVLDVGCGPGTITVDLAQVVAPGRVVGIDLAPEALLRAGELAGARGADNVLFEVANVYDLPYRDGSFDVVHAHQVLQHLVDPVAALRELRRVLRPGGLLAVRDADYGAMTWFPHVVELQEWTDLYHRLTRTQGTQADAGRRLHQWVREAGFADLEQSASTWCFADPDSRAWWGGTWAERVEHSALARHLLDNELVDEADLARLAQGWRRWAADVDGWFVVVHGEVLARL